MYYWNTGDRVIDVFLQQMEGLSRYEGDPGPEPTHELLCALIDIKEMLPQAVACHFKLPFLHVGGDHFDRGPKYRESLVEEITTALKAGLERLAEDPKLKRGGGADFSDRPLSLGETILERAAALQKELTQSKLVALQQVASRTHFNYRIDTIEKLLNRKRPYRNQDPKAAIYSELYRIEFEAERYFSVRFR